MLEQLTNSLTFIFHLEINKILDKISLDYSIDRFELNRYLESSMKLPIPDYSFNINPPISSSVVKDIPVVQQEIKSNPEQKLDDISIQSMKLCKGVTKKGVACTSKPKPNSEFCGRHE